MRNHLCTGLVPAVVSDRLALGMGRFKFEPNLNQIQNSFQFQVVVFGLYADFLITSSILYSPLGM